MPGINKWRTLDHVNRNLQSRKVTVRTIKERARRVLELVKKAAAGAPEVRADFYTLFSLLSSLWRAYRF